MRKCVLFGKRYMWILMMGRLELRPAIDWDAEPRVLSEGPSYGDLMAVLGRIEVKGGE